MKIMKENEEIMKWKNENNMWINNEMKIMKINEEMIMNNKMKIMKIMKVIIIMKINENEIIIMIIMKK